MLGTLSPQQIEDVLRTGLVGRLGCHAEGETYIVPISYGYDGRYIYCHTQRGKKTDMLGKNPGVCFEVDEMNNMANWKSVVLQGRYEEVVDRADKINALSVLLNRYLPILSSVTTHLGELWPFVSDNISEIPGVVFRIAIREKSGRFESTVQSPEIPG